MDHNQQQQQQQQRQQRRHQQELDDAVLRASVRGSLEDIRSLLDRHATVDALDFFQNTPLHHASMHGHLQCIELLLDRHASIDARAHNKITPLHLVSLNGHDQCVGLLLDRAADIDARTTFNQTALHIAARNTHHRCVNLLLDHGADISIFDVRLNLSLSSRALPSHQSHSTRISIRRQHEGRTPEQHASNSHARLLVQLLRNHSTPASSQYHSLNVLDVDSTSESRISSMERRATQPCAQDNQGPRTHDHDDSIDCVVVVDLAPSERALVLDL